MKISRICLLAIIFSSMFFLCACVKKNYHRYALFTVYPTDDDQLTILKNMWISHENREQVDFWQHPENVNETLEILVSPQMQTRIQRELDNKGIAYNITNDDIQRAIEEELQHYGTLPKNRKILKNEHQNLNFSQYNAWNDIEKYLQKLPDLFPDLTELSVIGQSQESRDLILVKIGNHAIKKAKPAVWVDAGIHAREWLSTATILYIIDSILNYYEGDETIQRYLDNIDWYFLPMMNPDGYVYSHTKDRMWRKNRSPAVCTKGTRKCCQGVDLNRNFGVQWGGSGSSRNPCSEVYMGPKAFSEPETRAVRDFVMAHAESMRAYFTFHSYGQLWLYPYGYKRKTYPEDVEELRRLSIKAVDNMRAVHGTRYKIGTAANVLYPSSGGADDWAKAEANIKYVFSIELRPASGRGNGFVVHPRNIIPTGEETWAGIRAVADKILDKYPTEEMSTSTMESATTTASTNPTSKPSTITAEPDEASEDEETRGQNACFDLSTRCNQFENQEKCNNNVVKAICRKLCKQC